MIIDYGLKKDKRKKLFMTLDVETGNGHADTINIDNQFFTRIVHHASDQPDQPLVYDLGFAINDKKGNIYYKASFIVEEIFYNEEIMNSAYYSNKVSEYKQDIQNGTRTVAKWGDIKKELLRVLEEYEVTNLAAYNMTFDRNALNWTNLQLTGKKWYFPHATGSKLTFHCIWFLACQTIFLQKTFPKWAIENGMFSPSGNFRTNAEVAYNWIHKTNGFEEEHTGLEDVLIEVEIMAHCLRQNKKLAKYKINRQCWRLPSAYHDEVRKEKGIKKLTKKEIKGMNLLQFHDYNGKRRLLGLDTIALPS